MGSIPSPHTSLKLVWCPWSLSWWTLGDVWGRLWSSEPRKGDADLTTTVLSPLVLGRAQFQFVGGEVGIFQPQRDLEHHSEMFTLLRVVCCYFSGGLVANSDLPVPGTWVRSLVRELRCRMLHSADKKTKERVVYLESLFGILDVSHWRYLLEVQRACLK